MPNFGMMAVLALVATAATAHTTSGNPAGTTLAPDTGAIAPSTPPAVVPAVAPSPGPTVAELAKIKYQTVIVCRTSIETGSLIAKKKTCLTRKQWEYVSDENQKTARRFVEDNTNKQGGGPN